ncbi:uncharacterized protein LOC129769708 [Toxorhynchites rutilus septentrionalis]|uniref:uncharacterized protein LOC129769708 n=1 Tax=Toxorhynchites rutilus septentrionalis TaxID=329112 RepID=UPI00247B18A6|nr:uncharacterized protein LOC129769708 [Toxorhynchites rutilus septentrionalis]
MAQLVKFFSFAIVVLLLLNSSFGSTLPSDIFQDAARVPRSTDAEEICYEDTPCGWAIYDAKNVKPDSRRILRYERNTCVCPHDLQCIRLDDDLQARAYVYRCRKLTS